MENIDSESVKENITAFDNAHIIKQIILIGVDGVTRNIEFEFMEEGEQK